MFTFHKEGNYVTIKKEGAFYDSLPACYAVRRLTELAIMVRPPEQILQSYSENHFEVAFLQVDGNNSEPTFRTSSMDECLKGLQIIFDGGGCTSISTNTNTTCPLWDDPTLTRINETLQGFLNIISNP